MPATVKAILDAEIANEQDADRKAKLELIREYFTNEEFRQDMTEMIWKMVNHHSGATNHETGKHV